MADNLNMGTNFIHARIDKPLTWLILEAYTFALADGAK